RFCVASRLPPTATLARLPRNLNCSDLLTVLHPVADESSCADVGVHPSSHPCASTAPPGFCRCGCPDPVSGPREPPLLRTCPDFRDGYVELFPITLRFLAPVLIGRGGTTHTIHRRRPP